MLQDSWKIEIIGKEEALVTINNHITGKFSSRSRFFSNIIVVLVKRIPLKVILSRYSAMLVVLICLTISNLFSDRSQWSYRTMRWLQRSSCFQKDSKMLHRFPESSSIYMNLRVNSFPSRWIYNIPTLFHM